MQDTQSIEAVMEQEVDEVEGAITRFVVQLDTDARESLHQQLATCRQTVYGYIDEGILSGNVVRKWSQRLRDLTAQVNELAPTERVPVLAV